MYLDTDILTYHLDILDQEATLQTTQGNPPRSYRRVVISRVHCTIGFCSHQLIFYFALFSPQVGRPQQPSPTYYHASFSFHPLGA